MAFLGKGSKVDLQVMAMEMGVEDVRGLSRNEKGKIGLDEIRNSIVCEVQTFEDDSCPDIEGSIDAGNIENEAEEEDGRRKKNEQKNSFGSRNEIEERKMACVEEQMRHVQEERKTSMKDEQKCLPGERCKRMNEQNQLLNEEQEKLSDEDMEVPQSIEKVLVFKGEQVQTRSADQYTVAQSVAVEKEKEETSVDVIKDKGDLNLVFHSKERMNFDEDEVEEEKPNCLKENAKK
ncbi:hypothetical protein TNCV_4662211 [Trichonephila clavipes]|uniref:Uncharacterized protein n=1 Tax=Trichonephila clavipes TaxID=2585209 RepID=A0A8X6SD25_TRICX|nr:hypothetical protein TNCV_4662211 [Trichonephila clavipes]